MKQNATANAVSASASWVSDVGLAFEAFACDVIFGSFSVKKINCLLVQW